MNASGPGRPAAPLCAALFDKIVEQIASADRLLLALPERGPRWAPSEAGAWTTGRLLGHLLDCLAGFCAALQAAEPRRLKHFARLRDMPVNHDCEAQEARIRMSAYAESIGEGMRLLSDRDLKRPITTVFAPEGELLITLLLGNLEHFINHKHQLFTYLQRMGVQVGSRDLYHFRETVTE